MGKLRRGERSRGAGMLECISQLLFVYDIGYLRSITEEIKILSNGRSATESIIVEDILLVVQLITQTIVGILKINADTDG